MLSLDGIKYCANGARDILEKLFWKLGGVVASFSP